MKGVAAALPRSSGKVSQMGAPARQMAVESERGLLPAAVVDRYCADGFVVLHQRIDPGLRVERRGFGSREDRFLGRNDGGRAVIEGRPDGKSRPDFGLLHAVLLPERGAALARRLDGRRGRIGQ